MMICTRKTESTPFFARTPLRRRAGFGAAAAIAAALPTASALAQSPPPPPNIAPWVVPQQAPRLGPEPGSHPPPAGAPAHAAPPAGPIQVPENEMPDFSSPGEMERRAAGSRRRWYGWQNLLLFAASDSLMMLGAGEADAPLVLGAWGGAMAGSLAIHLAHGNTGKGAGSLMLQLLIPPVVGGVSGAARNICFLNCGARRTDAADVLPGFAVAHLLVAIVDVAALSYEPRRKSTQASARRPPAATRKGWIVVPAPALGASSAALSAVGRF